jgi:hypothetical protein
MGFLSCLLAPFKACLINNQQLKRVDEFEYVKLQSDADRSPAGEVIPAVAAADANHCSTARTASLPRTCTKHYIIAI